MEHGMCGPTVKWSMAFPPGLPKIRLGQMENYAAFLSGFSDAFDASRILHQLPGFPAGLFSFQDSKQRAFRSSVLPAVRQRCPRRAASDQTATMRFQMDNSMNYAAGAMNAYPSGLAQNVKQEAPRTLASATGRLEMLNERLAKATDALSMACQQIGAMTGLTSSTDPKDTPTPIGAVHRLNDLADEANTKLSAIENYIASIQRALG